MASDSQIATSMPLTDTAHPTSGCGWPAPEATDNVWKIRFGNIDISAVHKCAVTFVQLAGGVNARAGTQSRFAQTHCITSTHSEQQFIDIFITSRKVLAVNKTLPKICP